jgi:hypothetical protein
LDKKTKPPFRDGQAQIPEKNSETQKEYPFKEIFEKIIS